MLDNLIFIQSANEYRRLREKVMEDWQSFQASGNLPEAQRSFISSSWKRCKQFEVNPYTKTAELVYSDRELADRQQHEHEWTEITAAYIDEFCRYFNEPIALGLADGDGSIIHNLTQGYSQSQLEKKGFLIGTSWSEELIGTNSIGTALVEKRPLQILAEEHFCHGLHNLLCSAVPILDPMTEHVIGVISFPMDTGEFRLNELFGLIEQVKKIERGIGQRMAADNMRAMQSIFSTSQEPFVIFDRNGIVTFANEYAQANLAMKKGQSISTVLGIEPDLLFQQNVAFNPSSRDTIFRTREGMEWAVSFLPYKTGAKLYGGMAAFQKMVSKGYPKNQSLLRARYQFDQIVTKDSDMQRLIALAKKAAFTDKSVMITGETGTGKEMIAQSIHDYGNRKNEPFVAVNCGAIPKELLASELFGYEGGSFTGARSQGKKGKFQLADKGTIFLDEIGEMPLDAQVYLLRVLEERIVMPIGSSQPIPIDVRVIAATHKDLKQEITKGNFREDLYYRLQIISLSTPPLRKRKEDIPLLVQHFLRGDSSGGANPAIAEKGWAALQNYSWPGNIRQLKNVIDQAIFQSSGGTIQLDDFPAEIHQEKLSRQGKQREEEIRADEWTYVTKRKCSKEVLLDVLTQTNGNVAKAASIMNVSRVTIYRKMKQYKISI